LIFALSLPAAIRRNASGSPTAQGGEAADAEPHGEPPRCTSPRPFAGLVVVAIAGNATLTLVFAPMLVVAVVVSVLLVSLAVFDGESTWLEGASLIGLYVIIAASFWWG
jgi:Ca2+/H+ antiporter